MTDALLEEIPLAHARVKRLKEEYDRPRTFEQIQTNITLYNPEQELETVLEEFPAERPNLRSSVDNSHGYSSISPPSKLHPENRHRRSENVSKRGGIERFTKKIDR
jgi:hypothetical protein